MKREVFENRLIPLFGNNKKVRRAIIFWDTELRSAVNHKSWTDGVWGYTALKIGIPYIAPWSSFTKDLGSLDARGISPRTTVDTYTRTHKPKISYVDGRMICLRCDRRLFGIAGYKFTKKIIRKVMWELYLYRQSKIVK